MNAISTTLTRPDLDLGCPPAETALAIAFVDLALQFAAKANDCSVNDLQAPRRLAHLVRARAMFVWLVKNYRPGISYPAIARWLGERNHPGVIYLHRKAERLRSEDPSFLETCEEFAALCRRRGEVPYACD